VDDQIAFTIFGLDPEIFAIKALFFLVVAVVAAVVAHLLVKLCHKALRELDVLPSATIIVNCVRVAVWVVALLVVLEPVFGISPSSFFAALGVGAIVISLGLKDTISNIFGGFMLMVGRVVQPGDYVTVAGVTGTVVDITMRHTVVENRLDERIVIPNSVLNTTSIQRLPTSTESRGTLEFTMEAGYDPDVVAADIVATVEAAGGERLHPELKTSVMFDSLTPYGVKGFVYFYLREDIPFAGVRSDMVRALALKPYFSMAGTNALDRGGEGVGE
jgi:small-conductance mechanosensitive channel